MFLICAVMSLSHSAPWDDAVLFRNTSILAGEKQNMGLYQ